MKIAEVTSGLHKEFGGPPVAVVGASSGLANLGHQVHLLVFGQSKTSQHDNAFFIKRLLEAGVKIHFSKSKKTSIYGGIGSIRDSTIIYRVIAQSDIVVIHQLYNFQNAVLIPLSKILSKPLVLMPHGTLTHYQTREIGLKKRLFSPYFEYLLKNFVTGIFVATNKEFMELSPKLKAKAYVVGLGLEEIEPFDSQRQVSESFNFLYLGRITKKKRIDVALEAISKLRSLTTRNIHFNICGSGDEIITQEIKKRIAELSLNEIVSFHGWIAGRAKLEIIRNSDCFILTSEDENFAIAVAESLQCGVPTIISEQVALSQVVEEYGAGIIFKDLDSTAISCAMLKLMESNQATLRESARNASAQFNWKKVAINWHNSLLEVLNQ